MLLIDKINSWRRSRVIDIRFLFSPEYFMAIFRGERVERAAFGVVPEDGTPTLLAAFLDRSIGDPTLWQVKVQAEMQRVRREIKNTFGGNWRPLIMGSVIAATNLNVFNPNKRAGSPLVLTEGFIILGFDLGHIDKVKKAMPALAKNLSGVFNPALLTTKEGKITIVNFSYSLLSTGVYLKNQAGVATGSHVS